MRPRAQSRKLARVSGVHCRVRASSTSGCASVHFTVHYWIECSDSVSSFQAQNLCHQSQDWAKRHLALHLLSLTILHLYCLSPASPPPVSDSPCLFTRCICRLLYYPTVLFKVLYCKMKNVFIFCLFFMYYLCERYYKPITVGFPGDSVGKESTCNVGYLGLTQGLGRFLGEGNGYQLQYSGLENLMGCIVHGIQRVRHDWATFTFIVQYYITICVSWVPRLTLLDLWINETFEHAFRTELVHMPGTYFINLMTLHSTPLWEP